MADVPHELITEILRLLPVKTLLRFRCISKLLHDMIDSPDFINWHLCTNSSNKTHRKIIFLKPRGSQPFNHPVPVHVADIDDPYPRYFHTILPRDETRTRAPTIFAHCNGLVLLGDDRNNSLSLVVWNPSTRKHRQLPVIPKEVPMEYRNLARLVGWGFGYDASMDDYKVLLLKEILGYEAGDQTEIWIFGLRLGYWRRVGFLPNKIIGDVRNCFVDGAFHFVCLNHLIFAFDLAKETLSKVYLPDCLPKLEETLKHAYYLQVLEERLSLSFLSWKKLEFELYSRNKNDGNEFSWTKLFSIRSEQVSRTPCNFYFRWFGMGELLGFSKGGDKIFVMCHEYAAVYSFDFRGKSIERNITPANKGYKHDATFCIESLVSVDYPEQERKRKGGEKEEQEKDSSITKRWRWNGSVIPRILLLNSKVDHN